MAKFGQLCALLLLCLTVCKAELSIYPPAFLPGVTKEVVIKCSQPTGPQDLHLLSMHLYKEEVSIASYVVYSVPKVDALGIELNVTVTGSNHDVDPHAAVLSVHIPQPKNNAEGRYNCIVQTICSQGQICRYTYGASLTSLERNESVPAFYQAIVQELRTDLTALTSDLQSMAQTQIAEDSKEKAIAAHINTIETMKLNISSRLGDISTILYDLSQKEISLRSELARLMDMTPDSPTSFFAQMTSNYITLSPGSTIVFNSPSKNSSSSYSVSTGIFTAPLNGTYFFVTGALTTGYHAYLSLVVNNDIVASLYAYDDYAYKQSTAAAVVELTEGDEVKVVQASAIAGYIYGFASLNYLETYFLGNLLWQN